MTPELIALIEKMQGIADEDPGEPDAQGFEIPWYADSPEQGLNAYYRYSRLNNNNKGNRVRFLNNQGALKDEKIAISWRGR